MRQGGGGRCARVLVCSVLARAVTDEETCDRDLYVDVDDVWHSNGQGNGVRLIGRGQQ
jgi:hypothetical protein